jgi:glycosyltransferase involved in cell wall biosynthesis
MNMPVGKSKSKTRISCLIHVFNDERTIGRTLEVLRVCDEIVVVDHGSSDDTVRIARQYGARIIPGVAGVDKGAYAVDCGNDWVFCLLPTETINEGLEAAVFEWKQQAHYEDVGFCFQVREETDNGWKKHEPQMRLVNRQKLNWQDIFPAGDGEILAGEVLRLK